MMFRAVEARELVTKTVEKEIAEKRARATVFCDTELSEAIKARANEKYTNVVIEVEQDIKYYVMKEVQEYGYEVVENANNTISVKW